MTAFGLRRATPADIPVMAENVRLGVASYAAWAPPDWAPLPPLGSEEELREWWSAPGFGAHITADGHAHVAARDAGDEPGVVHLLNLFARERLQGTGVAAELLKRAVADARVAGATAMRLRTPVGNLRALAFYEREGWTRHGSAGLAPALGLECVWMRRPL